MYKIIGKIDNFDAKKSYGHLGLAKSTVVAGAKPSIATVAVHAVKAIKSPVEQLNKKLLKRAKHEWNVTNPNHKDKRIN